MGLDLFQFLIIFTNYVVDSNNDSVLGILLPGERQRMEYCVKILYYHSLWWINYLFIFIIEGSTGIPSLKQTLNEPSNNPNSTNYFEMDDSDLTWIG